LNRYQLARLEGKCALEVLYTRWPTLALAVKPEQIRWRRRAGLRAIISLPVAVTGNGRKATHGAQVAAMAPGKPR
jgi:cytochrome P450 PksS